MPLNTNIALGVQPVQFESPMKMAMAANQLRESQLKSQEYEAALQERNALRQLNPNDPDYANQLARVSPAQGMAYRKSLGEAQSAEATRQKTQVETFAAKRNMVNGMMRDLSNRPDDENVISHFRDVQASPLFTAQEKADLQARTDRLLKMPLETRGSFLASQGATAAELRPQAVAPGGSLVSGDKAIYTAPAAPTNLAKLQSELAALPANDPRRADYMAQIRKETTHAPGTTVQLPPQEKAFESELGKEQAGSIVKSKTAAQDAASIIDTVKTGRDIMKSGMITGAGADFLVNLNQGLKTAGIDAGYADAAANSQAFTANMAGNVGKLIKQFGAGTGLSDADREFAKDMAGGRISLDSKAINRILDINERAARNVITRHNKDVKGIRTNIPLEVEMPPEIKAPAASSAVTNPKFPGFSIGKQ